MESGRVAVHLESPDPGSKPQGLLDVNGREAMTPKTGASGISASGPGVYFSSEEGLGTKRCGLEKTQKVLKTE
jgi:hypothetical protein